MDLQTFIDALVGKESRDEFLHAGGITLGQMIQLLEQGKTQCTEAQWTRPIQGLVHPHSYRGYYERLAFEKGETCLAAMLADALDCIDRTFYGWKGGEYTMGPGSMIHVAPEGSTQDDDELTIPRLMAIIEGARHDG